MSDIAKTGLLGEIWAIIAQYLDNDDLANFRKICTVTRRVGSSSAILQPLYNRLYAMDKSLPPLLPKDDKGALEAFKAAFLKIKTRQQEEWVYLPKNHHGVTTQAKYTLVFTQNTSVTLTSLEAKNTALDDINCEIIRPLINLNSTVLGLYNKDITRLPVSLFKMQDYVNYWKNLTLLNCCGNNLATLNVQGLTALKKLWCHYNQLTTLNVQGLTALQELYCEDNQLTTLNVQGLTALQELGCWGNQLTTLNVQGLKALQVLDCSENRLTALNVQGLTALQGLGCRKNQLTILNVQGLTALQKLYCQNNQLTTLNVQGLTALQVLTFNDNPLVDLNLTGAHPDTQSACKTFEKSLLWKQLISTDSVEQQQAIISRLGNDYTYGNCLYYAPNYALKAFTSTVYSTVTSYLPSFSSSGENKNKEEDKTKKRKRSEDEVSPEKEDKKEDKRPKR